MFHTNSVHIKIDSWSCRFKRHYQAQATRNFSHNRRTFSRGIREPNPPAFSHKASELCVVKCVAQCAHTNFCGFVMSLKRLRIFQKLRAYDSVALTS